MAARVGLIGHPVGHSVSPVFQQAAFDACGIDARYEAWDVEAAELAPLIEGLRGPRALGANVTIPYKEAALREMDRLHQTARFVGAINTIVRSEGATPDAGELEGYNTDVTGFQRTLEEAGFDPRGRQALVWGAGGAARAVCWALIWRGVDGITIVNRSGVRAGRLRHDLASAAVEARLRSAAIGEAEAGTALATCDLVVQCTPVGLRGGEAEGELPFEVERLGPGTQVVDLVANPLETPLVAAARSRGLPAVGGLAMLVYQGAAAFELWTRREAPVDTMMAAARAAMSG